MLPMHSIRARLVFFSFAIFISACSSVTNTGHENHVHGMDHAMTHETNNMDHTMTHDEHAGHQAMLEKKYKAAKYQTNVQTYKLNNLPLVRMDEQVVELTEELPANEPVILNFIFTSCTTVCPVLSATFSQFQDKLGKEADKIKMVSISIDPEYDTPIKLREYANKFNAGPQWQFYTGTVSQSIEVQRAFDAYRGGKMNHIPLTFLRAPGNTHWLRLEGFTSSSELISEYQRLIRG